MHTRTTHGLAVALATLSAVGIAHAQPQRIPAPPSARPSFESALPAGTTITARWDLPADSTATPIVLAQTVHDETELACVAGAFVNGAWVLQTAAKEPADDNPVNCLSAARVDNRWVVARWTLGGWGDGPHRVNESSVEFFALVANRFQSVWSGAATEFFPLYSGAQLDLRRISPRHELLSWSPDHTRLVVPAPAARPTAPRAPARH
jgi:hypothetical protein